MTLTASNVFAEGYDASRRTERLGLSFYDGRALYVAYIKVYPSLGRPEEHSFELERLHTGQSIEDMANSYNPDADQGYFGQDGKYLIYGYYSVETDGSLKLITDGSFANYPESAPYHWLSKYLLTYKPGISAEDLAVETYDNILPNAQDWARRGILLAVLLLLISMGLNKFRELTSGGSKVSSNGEDKAGSGALAYDKLSRSDRKLFDAAVSGTLATGLSERLLSKDLRDAADFISGRAFGLEFDVKVQNSNRILLESFGRLSQEEQDALLEEYRNISWGASYEESIEKRFLAFRGENFADEANPFNLNRESYGGRSGRYYVARGGVLEGFNSFEGEDDEEDGEPPF
ncbi:MAG: hypothetical protein IJY15_06975 [Thermoguttaceae bacterium]|nr:hypothetical protein [Thermoguttaceae bacterium]